MSTPTQRRWKIAEGIKVLATGAALMLVTAQCSTNPATGKKQLSLYSEAQEIQIGRQADGDIVGQYGLYPDPELQAYVQRVGEKLAAESERPNLPWTFRVVDDPVVNAFALPGGFIYITRGILAHMSSEAELAGVLGHEIGHVTGRHGINQMSKAQIAQVGLGVGMVLSPELRSVGGLAQQSLGLMFLKFGRDAERQADDLGFRYVGRNGYSPAAMAEVFSVLDQVSSAAGGGGLPSWLSSHPAPANRRQNIEAKMASVPPEVANAPWLHGPYLSRIDNVVFGEDPRQGYFQGSRFYHPQMGFQMEFPAGWKTQNQRQAVVAVSPEQDAIFALSLVPEASATAAAQKFFSQEGVEQGGVWLRRLGGGQPAVARSFRVASQEQALLGGVAFTEYGGQTLRLLGYTKDSGWRAHERQIKATASSFRKLTDRRILSVEPMRLELVTLDRDMSLEEFARRYPSSVPLQELALINHVSRGEVLRRGTQAKRVVGFNPKQSG